MEIQVRSSLQEEEIKYLTQLTLKSFPVSLKKNSEAINVLFNQENFKNKLQTKIDQFQNSGYRVLICTDRIPYTSEELAWKIEYDLGIAVFIEGNPSTREHVVVHFKEKEINREDLRKYLKNISVSVCIPRYEVVLSEDFYKEKLQFSQNMKARELFSKLKPLSNALYKVEVVNFNGQEKIVYFGKVHRIDFVREAAKIGITNLISEEEYKLSQEPQNTVQPPQQTAQQQDPNQAFALLQNLFTGNIQQEIATLQNNVSSKMDALCSDFDEKMKAISKDLKAIEENSDIQEMSKNIKNIVTSIVDVDGIVKQIKSSQEKHSNDLSSKISSLVENVSLKLQNNLDESSKKAIVSLEQKIIPQVTLVKEAAQKAATQQPILDELKKDLALVREATKRIEQKLDSVDNGFSEKVKKSLAEQLPKIQISVKN